ncbi:MAG: holo-ACP synthase [Treponema sp.]|nr:holo-ACP synthase [Treponema sp.]
MIYGIGTDIAKVSRFERWLKNNELISRFFAEEERFTGTFEKNPSAACQHYAARFAAKEAFAKALGTGFVGLTLKDFWVIKNEEGKPSFAFGEATRNMLFQRAGKCVVHLSLSHEKEFATAFVIIEKTEQEAD